MPDRVLDAVVIGAGQAGLAASHGLRAAGLDHVVLERGRIGDVWRTQRWDSFALNTPSWMNRLPGDAETDVLTPADGFASAPAFADQLEDYARRWQLPVREAAAVERVEPRDDLFAVHVRGDDEPSVTRSVVVASGIQNVPRIPAEAARIPLDIVQVTGIGYRSPDHLPPGAVLVVGSAQTGGQITEDLLEAGRTVFISTSKVPRLRRRYRGREVTEWLVESGFLDITLEQLADPSIRYVTMFVVSGIGRYGRTVSLQHLAAQGARLVGRLRGTDGRHLKFEDDVAECIRFGDRRAGELTGLIDDDLRARGVPLPPIEDDPADEPASDPDAFRSPTSLDLTAEGIASIVWATGVHGDFGFLPGSCVDADGRPIHDHGAMDPPGLFCLGFPWLRRRSSGIVFGVAEDARSIVGLVADRAAVMRA